ncbi:MAG: hypothetical protein AAGA66_04520 [Bacteroidota bacterium]
MDNIEILSKGKEEVIYDQAHITISYDTENEILINDWKGLLTWETVQDGCLNMIDVFKSKRGYKILNSNVNLTGSWAVGVEWTSEVWAPQILEEGLKRFAWVHSKANFAELSASSLVSKIKDDQKDEIFASFQDYDEAYQWLLSN